MRHKEERKGSLLMFQGLEAQAIGTEGAKGPRQADYLAELKNSKEDRAQGVKTSVEGPVGYRKGLDFVPSRWEATGRVSVEKSHIFMHI